MNYSTVYMSPVLGAHVVWRILEEVNLSPTVQKPVFHLCHRLLPGAQSSEHEINDDIIETAFSNIVPNDCKSITWTLDREYCKMAKPPLTNIPQNFSFVAKSKNKEPCYLYKSTSRKNVKRGWHILYY